ncbi:MAG: hypothetical protein JXA50_08365 [Deltaproteobacteria bacterium]|nr:hypothetical protein [Deltaproteobacteria bacterium]
MNPLIQLYDFHKNEFKLKNNTFLRLFEELLSTPPCSILECSAQISPKGTHGARFRLGYGHQDIQEGLSAIHNFLGNIAGCKNVQLNSSMLSQIVNNDLDVSRAMAIGVGLDYTTNIIDSKVKFYVLIREYPEKVNQILSLHPPLDSIRDYLIHEEFCFGINMYFDGSTSIEIYPYLDQHDLNNTALMIKLKLRDVPRVFIEKCDQLYVSFEDDGRRVLHFTPQSSTKFVRSINNRQLSLAYSSVQILNYLLNHSYHKETTAIFSLKEDEILSENIQNINLLYNLTSRA